MVTSLASLVEKHVLDAIVAALPGVDGAEAAVRRSERADFQADGVLALAKRVCGNPRELAARVVAALPAGEVVARVEASGPGFLNVTVTDRAITANLAARAADPRLGVPRVAQPGRTVIDYAQPNVAKEMHVGHLRNSIIGDAVARLLELTGEVVIRRHHIGDWGTQFGMLVEHLIEHPEELDADAAGGPAGEVAMSNLNRLYRAASARFKEDADFKERARRRVVALQAGDPETRRLWQRLVDESKLYFRAVFEQLDVPIRDEDVIGESGYNHMLAETCRLLEERGVAVRSDGALCVFFDDVVGKDGTPTPLIVQKADGGYGYAATDLSAIRDRVERLGATTLLYVVDARQALHFRMVFETARRAGWLPAGVRAVQLAFGTVLGADGKPLKTRDGASARLVDLLDEATARAAAVVRARAEVPLGDAELAARAAQVGIGAVKYADLSTTVGRDYKFDLDRMVALDGDTSVYLQYAYARIASIGRKADGVSAVPHPELTLEPAERALGLHLDGYAAAVLTAARDHAPSVLAGYLYQLAGTFARFYEHCPVLRAERPALVEHRLFLCELTARTLAHGLGLLGIATPERL